MQPPQIRQIGGVHPSHLQPHISPHGLWYSQQMAHHLMPPQHGGESPPAISSSKKTSKKGAAAGGDVNLNANRNNNNALDAPPSAKLTAAHSLYVAQYQAQAFPKKSQETTSYAAKPTNVVPSLSKESEGGMMMYGTNWPLLNEPVQQQPSTAYSHSLEHTFTGAEADSFATATVLERARGHLS